MEDVMSTDITISLSLTQMIKLSISDLNWIQTIWRSWNRHTTYDKSQQSRFLTFVRSFTLWNLLKHLVIASSQTKARCLNEWIKANDLCDDKYYMVPSKAHGPLGSKQLHNLSYLHLHHAAGLQKRNYTLEIDKCVDLICW